jgi:hypothetical protein
MTLHQLEYLIHGNILPMSIDKHRMSDRLVLETVYGDGYQDSTWGERVGHVKAYVGVESDGTSDFFYQAGKYLTLFLHLYTLQAGQPYVVFRPTGIGINDFTKLGEISRGYPKHKPIVSMGEPLPHHISRVSKLKSLFQQVESDFDSILDSPIGLAMQFFYDAVMSNHRRRLELAVVHFLIAAEALVILRDESKRQYVSKRIGVLFSETLEEYESTYKDMKELWDVRSGIVHGGGKKASPMDVGLLYKYLRKAITERLFLRQISKPELVKRLDQISENWEKKAELKNLRQFEWQ